MWVSWRLLLSQSGHYWVSQGKKWCDYCKIFIANNDTSLRNHEIGLRHKEAMAQRLTTMRKDNIAKEKEKQQALKDLERIEQGVGKKVQALCPLEAEFARPAWVFGISSFAFFGNSGTQIVCTHKQRGLSHLATLDLASGSLSPIKTRFTDIYNLFAAGNEVFFSASHLQTLSLL